MSWSERHVQDQKRRTDHAVHRAFARLASDPAALEKFQELLTCARARAPRMFEAAVFDGEHPGVQALVNLSRFRNEHIRRSVDWPGTSASWRPATSSFANHLICRFGVPPFFASCWHATDQAAERKRRWCVEHSRGASFRSLNVPIAMTRKMEHIFLASPDHLSIEYAMRRAELLALGVPAEFVKAILATRLATDLRHGEFWRTVWMFLIANADDVEPAQVGPMIDYIQAVLDDRTDGGMVEFGSGEPAFSMKGRTMQSMLRLMRAWHRSLGFGKASLSWVRSPFEPMQFEELNRDDEHPRHWQMMELTNSVQLQREGAALRHCVASYADLCYRGKSSIWSLRFRQAGTIHHVLTVEVNPRKREVVQARGRANREASAKPLRLLQDWAVRERLRMAI